MPSKYVVREFEENGYYHVFNRGVEKRKIFLDENDYKIFLYYMFIYLEPEDEIIKKYPTLPLRLQNKNLNKELKLISYCLMPNHFHFLLLQKNRDSVSKFMKQLTNAYTFYFNNKYKRVGGLMQSRFKTTSIKNDELLLHISRYIHLNPIVDNLVSNLEDYPWSSYPQYVGGLNYINCSKEIILANFNSPKDYKKFILDQVAYGQELAKIKHLAIDLEA